MVTESDVKMSFHSEMHCGSNPKTTSVYMCFFSLTLNPQVISSAMSKNASGGSTVQGITVGLSSARYLIFILDSGPLSPAVNSLCTCLETPPFCIHVVLFYCMHAVILFLLLLPRTAAVSTVNL